jgi:hypothetical protein
LALARFHCFDVHFETSSTWEDVDDGGVVVCASGTPDVTAPRITAATNTDRTNDILPDSMM